MGFSRQEYWSGLPMPISRGSSRPRDRAHVSYVACVGRWRHPISYVSCLCVNCAFGFILLLFLESEVCRGGDHLVISLSRAERTPLEGWSWILTSLIPSSSGRILFPMGYLWLSWSRYPKLANLKMYSEFSWDFLTWKIHLSIPSGFQSWWDVCLQAARLEESLLDHEDSYDIF